MGKAESVLLFFFFFFFFVVFFFCCCFFFFFFVFCLFVFVLFFSVPILVYDKKLQSTSTPMNAKGQVTMTK